MSSTRYGPRWAGWNVALCLATCWLASARHSHGQAPADESYFSRFTRAAGNAYSGARRYAGQQYENAADWVADTPAGNFVAAGRRGERNRQRMLTVLSHEGAIYRDRDGKWQVKDERSLNTIYQALQDDGKLLSTVPKDMHSGQFWHNFLAGKQVYPPLPEGWYDPFKPDSGMHTRVHLELASGGMESADISYGQTARELGVSHAHILNDEMRRGVAAGADLYIRALDQMTGGVSTKTAEWAEKYAERIHEEGAAGMIAKEVKDYVVGQMSGEFEKRFGDMMEKPPLKGIAEKYEHLTDEKARLEAILRDAHRLTGDERLAAALKTLKELDPETLANGVKEEMIKKFPGQADQEGVKDDQAADPPETDDAPEKEGAEADPDSVEGSESPEDQAADGDDPAADPDPADSSEQAADADEPDGGEGDPAEASPEEPSPDDSEDPVDQDPDPDDPVPSDIPSGKKQDAPDDSSPEDDAPDDQSPLEVPAPDDPPGYRQEDPDPSPVEAPGEADDGLLIGPPSALDSTGYQEGDRIIDDSGVEYQKTADGWRDTGDRYDPITQAQKDQWSREIDQAAAARLRGKEPGSPDLPAPDPGQAPGPSTLERFGDSRDEQRQQQHASAATTMQQQLDMTQASRSGDDLIQQSKILVNAAGRDAQQILQASAQKTAQKQREDSWSTELGNAIEAGVTTGGEAFGSALGSAAAGKVSSKIFGPSSTGEDQDAGEAGGVPVAGATVAGSPAGGGAPTAGTPAGNGQPAGDGAGEGGGEDAGEAEMPEGDDSGDGLPPAPQTQTSGTFTARLVPSGSSYYIEVSGVETNKLSASVSGTDGYANSFSGTGSIRSSTIPSGSQGVNDTVTARDLDTGETATFNFKF